MIELKNVCVKAGRFTLEGINLSIAKGQYAILIGKTGSGKTTILETICGIKKISSGSIMLNDKDITHLKSSERNIGFVPQDHSLFTNLSVFENIAFSLRIRNWTIADINSRVSELASLLKIESIIARDCLNLSGGEKQRVALARALAFYPSVVCLDEPLSALDEETHLEICDLLKQIQNIYQISILHITHNKKEVEWLADITYKIDSHQVLLIDNPLQKEAVI